MKNTHAKVLTFDDILQIFTLVLTRFYIISQKVNDREGLQHTVGREEDGHVVTELAGLGGGGFGEILAL